MKTPSWDKLPHDMCMCNDCSWRGPTHSCELSSEVDEYYNVDRHYHICPVCSLWGDEGDITDYWSSIASVMDEAKGECITMGVNIV